MRAKVWVVELQIWRLKVKPMWMRELQFVNYWNKTMCQITR